MHFLFEFDYHDLQKYTLKPQFSIGSVTGQDYILKDSNSVKLFTECVGSKLSYLIILFREVRLLLPHQVLSVPKFIENLYCICLSIPQIYTKADAVQICGRFWDTQYIALGGNKQLKRPNFTIRIFHKPLNC